MIKKISLGSSAARSFCYLFVLVSFSFSAYAVQTVTVTASPGWNHCAATQTTITAVPFTLTVTTPNTRARVGNYADQIGQGTSQLITNPAAIGELVTLCLDNSAADGDIASVTITYPNEEGGSGEGGSGEGGSGEGGSGEGGSGEGGSGDNQLQPYATESTLSVLSNAFNSFASSSLSMQNVVRDYVYSYLPMIEDHLSDHSQLLNEISGAAMNLDDTVSGFTSLFSDLSDTASDIKNVLDDSKDLLDHMSDAIDDSKDLLDLIFDGLDDLYDYLTTTNRSQPILPDPSSSLPSRASLVSSIRSKLLPRTSFFTISGDQWPSYTFTFDLQPFGLDSMTFVMGGNTWTTFAGGIIPTIANFVRTLTKFLMYYMFLHCIILYLRQW